MVAAFNNMTMFIAQFVANTKNTIGWPSAMVIINGGKCIRKPFWDKHLPV